MADPKKLGVEAHRLHPKLRMIRNGDSVVNAVRAEHSGFLRVATAELLGDIPLVRGNEASPDERRPSEVPTKQGLLAPSGDVEVNLFVSLTDESATWRTLPGQSDAMGSLRTVTIPLDEVGALVADEYVAYVEPGDVLKAPTPIVTSHAPAAPSVSERRIGAARKHRYGQNILIGIIDVQGFDFAHPDFLDAQGGTRFVRIWDQGGNARPSPQKGRFGFDYGAEFTKEHLDAALSASALLGIPPQDIERQSQLAPGSHGTHVASIAAGNRGICRKALLAGVLIALTDEDVDRRRSFYDSTRIVHAIDYLLDLGRELGNVPVSINVSLGTNGHAHDGSSGLSRWLDSALAVPGRSICIAAGNAGQHAPEFPGDIGYVMGRVHTSGRIAASGLTTEIGWEVTGNTRVDLSENELEIWYHPQDRFSVQLRPPGSNDWLPVVGPGEYIENHQLPNGSFFSIYNELYHPANGSNYISIFLSPLLSSTAVVGIPAGRWTVRVRGEEIRDGRYNAWIERDDPRRLGRLGEREAWRFPSYFSEDSFVGRSTVSSLACGQRVISVANLDYARWRINPSSSQGPTRDGREKPDVAAPGTEIVAACGFDPDREWIGMTGTSMASPHVCGIAGLMLAADPALTAAQIMGIIRRTARPLPGADYSWLHDAGFGVIDGQACVAEAAIVRRRRDLTP